MKSFNPNDLPTPRLHQYLVSTVAPRPIAFASTVDEAGNPNLAPYSFFNVFSSNPPLLVFSSNRRVSDNTTKDTLHNIEKTKEVVINVVSHNIVRQMAVASVQFDKGVNEFIKSGLTPIASDLVRPFRVQESPAQFECQVKEIIPLGEKGGAGHLIICEIIRLHLAESIFDEEGRIDPQRIDLVGRMGRAFYTRASGEAVFKVFQPIPKITIGYDNLPEYIRTSDKLTGNELGQLAGLFALPNEEALILHKETPEIVKLLKGENVEQALIQYAKDLLKQEANELALKTLMLQSLLS